MVFVVELELLKSSGFWVNEMCRGKGGLVQRVGETMEKEAKRDVFLEPLGFRLMGKSMI